VSSLHSELVAALRSQQRSCAQLGSSFYAGLLDRVIADVEADGVCAEAMRGPWSEDLISMAVSLRFLGALNRLVLAHAAPELSALWPPAAETVNPSIGSVMARAVSEHLDRVQTDMLAVVQTNEVARSGVLAGGFLTVARQTGLPLRLLELGASAGLNLCWDHYRYHDRGTTWGDPKSPLLLSGPYDGGPTPLVGDVAVGERRGCDLHPIDPADDADRLWLRSFVWPDQPIRLARLDAAISIASQHPSTIDAESAVSWLPAALRALPAGAATVVLHSIVLQYLAPEQRRVVADAIIEAGSRATADAPLAWLRFEVADPDDDRATLELITWPGEERRGLARAGYHGSPVTWT